MSERSGSDGEGGGGSCCLDGYEESEAAQRPSCPTRLEIPLIRPQASLGCQPKDLALPLAFYFFSGCVYVVLEVAPRGRVEVSVGALKALL